MALSPDGSTPYLAGGSLARGRSYYDLLVISYDTATGQQRWLARGHKPNSGVHALAVSPDGSTVYAGGAWNKANLTIAFKASTAKKRWIATYPEPGWIQGTVDLAMSPDDTKGFHIVHRSGAIAV